MRLFIRSAFVLLLAGSCSVVPAAQWSVPLAGNTFRTQPTPGEGRRSSSDTLSWTASDEVYSVFFHVSRPATLKLSLEGRLPSGSASVRTRVLEQAFTNTLSGPNPASCEVGDLQVPNAGYVRVDLQGLRRTGPTFGEWLNLHISSDTPELSLDYVRTNQGNMFYWGRRGPSVHLGYQVDTQQPLQYAYSEITVPVGQDPLGSYYMANGFAEGYFGIQVNGPTERRVLFSVWSPFSTDNPREIPEDQRILTLARGPGVRIGEFGNEGSGGQSILVYPWRAGVTYRFLTEVKPDGQGHTVYTSWFGEKASQEWRLIASFRRPKTDTHLRGFHSFLESFDPATGFIGRQAGYGNVWVCDIAGHWHEVLQARFSVDPTGGGRHRLDYGGGAEGERFYLRNCGFFSGTNRAGEVFSRSSSAKQQPVIDFQALPRNPAP